MKLISLATWLLHGRHRVVLQLVSMVCPSSSLAGLMYVQVGPTGLMNDQISSYITGLWYISHAFIWHAKKVATHLLPLIHHILCHNQHFRRDGLVVYRSCQTWAHILVGMWPGWRTSLCIDCTPGLSDLYRVPTWYVKRVATHPWHVVLPHVTIYTNLRVAWFFFSSHQISSPSVGGTWLGWTSSMCINCVSGLQDLDHALIKYMKYLATYPWPVVLHLITYSITMMDLWSCSSNQIRSHRLGALRLGWIESYCINYLPGF